MADAGGAASVLAFPIPAPNLAVLNPVRYLGGVVSASVADAWTTIMMSIWLAGLWLTRWVFDVVGALSTPDVSANGPVRGVLATTLWISATFALILMFVQLIVALVRRDGQSFGRLLLGLIQYGFVWAAFLGCAVGAVAAAAKLGHGILQATLGVKVLSSYDVTAGWARRSVDASAATVLGITSLLLLIPAAFFGLLIGLVRAAALIVLVAVAPITAAGLLSESTRAIFWKSLRWFISAVLIAPNTALVLGMGVKVSAGVVNRQGDKTAAALGTSVVGAVMVMVAVVSPLALFRLLAWVDPGTPSGAALRQSWSDAGMRAGAIGGRARGGGEPGNGAAGQVHHDGRSGGEAAAEGTTQTRIASAMGAFGTGVNAVTSIAMRAGDLAADVLGGAGVGSPGYSMTPADERAMRAGPPQPTGGGSGAPGRDGGTNGESPRPTRPPGSDSPGPAGGSGQQGSPGTPGVPGPAGPVGPIPRGPGPGGGGSGASAGGGTGAGAAVVP